MTLYQVSSGLLPDKAIWANTAKRVFGRGPSRRRKPPKPRGPAFS